MTTPLATDPNGNSISYQYWGSTAYDGRLKRVTQPAIPGQSAGRAVEFDYDAACRCAPGTTRSPTSPRFGPAPPPTPPAPVATSPTPVCVGCGEARTASIANGAVHFVYRILRAAG